MLQFDFSLPESEWLMAIDTELQWQQAIASFIDEWRSSSTVFSIQTSGSTGTPKTIQHSREALIQSASRTNQFFKLEQSSIFFLCLPINHIGGRMMLIRAILAKAKLICVAPTSNPLLSLAFSSPITFAAFTPMQSFEIMKDKDTANLFSSIQYVVIGGGKISDTLLHVLSAMPNYVYETFGMTETISHIALRSIAPITENYFQCLRGVSVSVDEHDLLQLKIEQQTAFATNDIVELIDSARFRWLGRKDDVINTGGIKVFAHQIENKLQAQFEIPFFITAVADDKFGQRVVLILHSLEVAQSLSKTSFEHLPNYERPKSIFVLEQFNYSGLGKLLKKSSIENHFLTRIDL